MAPAFAAGAAVFLVAAAFAAGAAVFLVAALAAPPAGVTALFLVTTPTVCCDGAMGAPHVGAAPESPETGGHEPVQGCGAGPSIQRISIRRPNHTPPASAVARNRNLMRRTSTVGG